MSTTIKSGSEYAHLLEASGMAYELSPLSIAEKAFEEGADSLRAALAATPGLRTDNPMAEPVMGGLPRYDGEKLGTPANQQPTP